MLWYHNAPRWICRLPVDFSGSLTATFVCQTFMVVKAARQKRRWRAAIVMVQFTLSLTLTFWCSSDAGLRCLRLTQVTHRRRRAGTPRGRAANASSGSLHPVIYAGHGFSHGHDFSKTITPPSRSHRDSPFSWLASVLLIDHYVWLVSLCETWVFDLITWFASCWGWLSDQCLNSPSSGIRGRHGRLAHVLNAKIVCFLFLVDSRRVHMNHELLGRLQISTRTQHGRCLSTLLFTICTVNQPLKMLNFCSVC